MSFINQFPYSDYHELNLDWIIKTVKASAAQIEYLTEEFAKIEVLTEDYINHLIEAAIAENNIMLYNRLIELKAEITTEYQNYTNDQINLLKIYVDSQDVHFDDLAKSYADNAYNRSKEYTDHAVLDYTMMINPITGEYDDVRNVVNDIIIYFHSENSLTAAEYDALDLTASAYDAYNLSAYDYDFNGKIILI